MIEPLNGEYLGWLIDQVQDGKEIETLLAILHEREFVWLVPNDDNRCSDGFELRQEFLGDPWDPNTLGAPEFVTVLEVLIGLSRRLAFQAGGSEATWARQLIHNLGLQGMVGPVNERCMAQIDEVLENLVWRRYNPDGEGGFFPLAYPKQDQRDVELWYQMSAYILELEEL